MDLGGVRRCRRLGLQLEVLCSWMSLRRVAGGKVLVPCGVFL